MSATAPLRTLLLLGLALVATAAPERAVASGCAGLLEPKTVFIKAEKRTYDPTKPWAAVAEASSSGRLLIPLLRQRGYNILQITTQPMPVALEHSLSDDYDVRILHEGDINATALAVLPYAPKALIIGAELAASYKDTLGNRLNQLYERDRVGFRLEVNEVEHGVVNKSRLAEVLDQAGLDYIQGILARNLQSALKWIEDNQLFPNVVVKPAESAGTDGFNKCNNAADVIAAFTANRQTNVLGRLNDGMLVQRFVEGPELVPNLVIRNGKAILTDAWEYIKRTVITPSGKKARIYKIDWLLDPKTDPRVKIIYDYVVAVSKALKNDFGFAHPEVILDVHRNNRPVIVDYGARIMGGNQPVYTEAALGHSQVDLGIEAIFDPAAFNRRFERQPMYELKKNAAVYSVMTRGNARASHRLAAAIRRLPSYFTHSFEYAEGTPMLPTVDMITTVAQIVLVHPDRHVIEKDLQLIEAWEGNRLFETRIPPTRE